MVTANIAGPTNAGGMLVQTGTTTARIGRAYFTIGSGDVSELRLSLFSFYISNGVGVVGCNGYTVNSASIEMNGVSVPITFAAVRSKVIGASASDVQSDVLLPSAFGLTKFAQGSIGYLRLALTFANPTTDVSPGNGFSSSALGAFTYDYDPTKVTITNGVDGTGPITYTMTGGGVNGTDIKSNAFPMTPAILGKFVNGDLPVWLEIGDSGCFGTGDTGTTEGSLGLARAMYPNPAAPSPAGALANWNLGCNGGIAPDWANGSPSLLNNYLKYFKYAIEEYGGNGFFTAASHDIHTQLRAAGVRAIIRTSLTPRTNSSDQWTTATQTQQSGWGAGNGADTYEQSVKALVAPDLTYISYREALADPANAWIWYWNGTPFYMTPEGLHPSTLGYVLKATGSCTITSMSGPSTGTLSSLVASFR